MKIVITSNGNSPDSKLDSHFGRCSHFVFYDTLTKSIEFFPNPFKDLKEEAGFNAVKLLTTRNIEKIVTGELGIKVKPLLDSLKIQQIIYKNKEKSIQDIINMLNH
jgi:predicted Fe-Mo cluster-binding NifX family protein